MTSQRLNEFNEDAIAAAQLALRMVKDASDAFPPLKSIAAMSITIIIMSQVSLVCK
jgi:hypothetical protein